MKHILIKTISVLLIFVLMTGCSSVEIIELNERLIIEAIGIDYKNGYYNVTIEGLDSFSAGSDTNSISAPSLTKCFSFKGETIGMAMNSISVITGQIPLFSQARVLILGLETAESKLSEVLDFFRREYTTRTDILIAIAKETAESVVAADYGENVSAGNIIEAALESSRYTGTCSYMPLYRFISSVLSKADSPYCPLISTKTNPFTDKKEIYPEGTVILKKDESVFLTPEETLSLNVINKRIQNGDITVQTKDGLCTLEIIDCKTKKRCTILKEKAIIDIEVNLRCDIPEYQSESFSGLSKKEIEEIAELAAEKIAVLLSDTVNKVYFSLNTDIFNFGRMMNLKNNEFFTQSYLNQRTIDSTEKCNISVSLSIRRIGKIIIAED